MIRAEIKQRFPEHNILGEEIDYEDQKSDYTWVIDPLDGTNNYANSYPIYAVSIALRDKCDYLLGVIYLPELDQLYSVIRGQGSFNKQQQLKVADKMVLNQALIATGFPYDKDNSQLDNLAPFNNLLKKLRGIRRSGSAAFDLTAVAAGKIDAYWEFKLSEWDYAAGELLVREAGGEVFKTRLEDNLLLIAGNKNLVRQIKETINDIYNFC